MKLSGLCGKSKLLKINVLSCYEIHSDLKTHARLVVKPRTNPGIFHSLYSNFALTRYFKGCRLPTKNKKAIINLL